MFVFQTIICREINSEKKNSASKLKKYKIATQQNTTTILLNYIENIQWAEVWID